MDHEYESVYEYGSNAFELTIYMMGAGKLELHREKLRTPYLRGTKITNPHFSQTKVTLPVHAVYGHYKS